jgi:hypothetical protein
MIASRASNRRRRERGFNPCWRRVPSAPWMSPVCASSSTARRPGGPMTAPLVGAIVVVVFIGDLFRFKG